MLPHVQGWYIDFRGHGPYLDPEIGGFILPPFPRGDETEFVYTVGGANIDATPSPRFFTISRRKTGQRLGTRCRFPAWCESRPVVPTELMAVS